MPKGIKHNSEESPTSPVTSPNMEVSFDDELCVNCNEPVIAEFLECIWFERWQHSRCIKISPEKFSNLHDLPINNAFFCCQCVTKLPSALSSYDKSNEACNIIDSKPNSMQENLSNRFDRLVEKVKDLTKLNEDAKKLEKAPPGSSKPPEDVAQHKDCLSLDSMASMTADIFLEEKEKEKRVHHTPESNQAESCNRKREDMDNLTVLFNKYVGVKSFVTNAIRIGKKTDRPRLIKVTLSSKEEKINILRSRRNLRNKVYSTHINKVFITPDLTPLQQRRNKQLRIELAELNKTNKYYMIKQGRIVRREMAPPRK